MKSYPSPNNSPCRTDTSHCPSKTELHSSRSKPEVLLQILPNFVCSSMKSSSPEWHYVEEITGLSQLDILYCYFSFTILGTQEKLHLTEPAQQMFIGDHTDRARKRIMQKWSRAWFLFSYTTTKNISTYLACYVPSNLLCSQTQKNVLFKSIHTPTFSYLRILNTLNLLFLLRYYTKYLFSSSG